jgi:glycosyltransferase involved in cell wall biosynthesis
VRVAIVHERFTITGGAERVVEQIHRIFPDATIHAAIVDRSVLSPALAAADIRTTPLQRLYRGHDRYAHLLPLLPLAFARMELGDVDLVVTSHYAFANRVRPPKGVPVVAYAHTPARWMWDPAMRRGELGGSGTALALGAFAATQRRADRAAARRLRAIVANSRNVADRTERWWGRSSTVVHPPVDVDWFTPDPQGTDREDFFLVAGRLVPYKKALVAVAAAEQAGVRLVVAGEGRQLEFARARAGPRIEVLGRVGGPTLRDLYRRCRALVFPGEEDFGIIPIEAQACGAPVIARAVGGALESVDDTTGVLYPAPSDGPGEVAGLADALRRFDPSAFDPAVIRHRAEAFSPERFRREFGAAIERAMEPGSTG